MAVRNYAGFDARARGHPNHWPILRSSTSQRGMDPSPRPLWGEGGERSEPGEGAGHFRSADETSDPKFPDRAALVLGNDPKSGEDGLLQVREIRGLNLAADLVTLSACDTGVGALEGPPTSSARSYLPGRSQWLRAFGLRATPTPSL